MLANFSISLKIAFFVQSDVKGIRESDSEGSFAITKPENP